MKSFGKGGLFVSGFNSLALKARHQITPILHLTLSVTLSVVLLCISML